MGGTSEALRKEDEVLMHTKCPKKLHELRSNAAVQVGARSKTGTSWVLPVLQVSVILKFHSGES